MKKIILILLFSFLSIPLFAQSIWWVDTTSAGVERKVYLGDYDSVRTSGGLNFGRLPVKATISGAVSVGNIDSLVTEITTLNISVDSLKADLATTKGYLQAVKDTLNVLKNKDFSTETSLLNAIDSLSALRDSLVAKVTATNVYLSSIISDGIKPYLYYEGVKDTLVTLDTIAHDFDNNYLKCYVSIYNTNGTTADTLVIEHYSIAKGAWTNQAIGLRDVLTDYLEIDNTSIIVASLATKMFEINLFRPGNIRVRSKVTNAGRRITTNYIYFRGIN